MKNKLPAILVIAIYGVLLFISFKILAPFFVSITAFLKLLSIGIALEILIKCIDDIYIMIKDYLDKN